MDECNNPLQDAAVFSVLGADSCYYQTEVKDLDCDKSALASYYGRKDSKKIFLDWIIPQKLSNEQRTLYCLR